MTTVPDPLVGSTVGRYRIARLVGHGGMGTVYEGVQAESGAAVAIKVLSERYAHDANLIERFFSEARATNVIAHENIVKVHDLARLDDGRPYIVMELLAGKTLRALVDAAPLPIGGVVNLVLEVLSALGATHAAGIVHRDIKPDNIFVTEKGRTKVLDFGIAKLTGANAVARTETGVLLGTPEYMAPEQITEGTVDVRTDLYALGALRRVARRSRRPLEARHGRRLLFVPHEAAGQVRDPHPRHADRPADRRDRWPRHDLRSEADRAAALRSRTRAARREARRRRSGDGPLVRQGLVHFGPGAATDDPRRLLTAEARSARSRARPRGSPHPCYQPRRERRARRHHDRRHHLRVPLADPLHPRRYANIAQECPGYPTVLPRCSIARQRTRANVRPDVKRVTYEYARDGWDHDS